MPHWAWVHNAASLFFVQSAVGHEYQSKLSKHCSQVDSVRGFGGKFGVQMDRVDQVRDGQDCRLPAQSFRLYMWLHFWVSAAVHR